MLVVNATNSSLSGAYEVFEGVVWVMPTHIKDMKIITYHSCVLLMDVKADMLQDRFSCL